MRVTSDRQIKTQRDLNMPWARGKTGCHKCGKPFNLLDWYHIRRIGNGTYWYHQSCWKALFY